jgi:FAD/FMN-containing dehydrogenase
MVHDDAMVIDALARVVGDANVATARAELEPALVDCRGRFHGDARAIVRPATTDEVAALVRICARARIPIVAQGGNTSMCGGATPDASGDAIVLSLSRMRAIRDVDAPNATMTLEAGVTLHEAQRAAENAGLFFPLSLASEGTCTIGGNVSTNAGGTAVLRYGNARELVLGIEAVLADGRVFHGLRGLRKNNTGYDLKQLFIGSEGTLAIVTAAVLKLFPAPRTRVTAFAALATLDDAVALLRELQQAVGDRLTGFELLSKAALDVSRRHGRELPDPLPGHPWYALLQVDDSSADVPLRDMVETALAREAEQAIVADATIAQSQEQANRLWALRENVSEAQRREGPNVKHDVSLPISAIPQFCRDTAVALDAAFPGIRLFVFGHLGDGNLHYNVAAPSGEDACAFLGKTPAINRIVHDRVVALGGSISAEHGIGQLKRDELRHYADPLDLELMRRIKSAFDPDGILNPGKVV